MRDASHNLANVSDNDLVRPIFQGLVLIIKRFYTFGVCISREIVFIRSRMS